MNQKIRITNRVRKMKDKARDFRDKAETVCGPQSTSLNKSALFAILFLFGTGLAAGCVGPASAFDLRRPNRFAMPIMPSKFDFSRPDPLSNLSWRKRLTIQRRRLQKLYYRNMLQSDGPVGSHGHSGPKILLY